VDIPGDITAQSNAGPLTYRGPVRGYRFALRPGWVAFTVICVALIVTMVLLGRWQLIVSNRKHFDLQNFGYALQWWAFSLFVAFMWTRILRDHRRRATAAASEVSEPGTTPDAQPAPESVAYRRYVMPSVQSQPQQAADPALAAYNDYLANLARRDATG
jgi:DNA-binding transcriptional regulator of glucitol operon